MRVHRNSRVNIFFTPPIMFRRESFNLVMDTEKNLEYFLSEIRKIPEEVACKGIHRLSERDKPPLVITFDAKPRGKNCRCFFCYLTLYMIYTAKIESQIMHRKIYI